MDMHNDISDVPGIREAQRNKATSQYDVTARQLPEKTYYIDQVTGLVYSSPLPVDYLESQREEMKAAREG